MKMYGILKGHLMYENVYVEGALNVWKCIVCWRGTYCMKMYGILKGHVMYENVWYVEGARNVWKCIVCWRGT